MLKVIGGLSAVSHRISFVQQAHARFLLSDSSWFLCHFCLRLQTRSTFSVQQLQSYFSTSHCTFGGRREAMGPENNEAVRMELSESETKSQLLFVKLTEHASAPTKGSKLSAGYDLMSAYDVVVPKRGSALVKTDIQIKLPEGTYGRVAPRSGLALKNKIDVGAGVIDEDYRGNVGVILFNHSDEDFVVGKGDRIAQLICTKIEYPVAVQVENLDLTDRGAAGFGSTGVKKAKVETAAENVLLVSPTKALPLSPRKQNIMVPPSQSPKKHERSPMSTSPVKQLKF